VNFNMNTLRIARRLTLAKSLYRLLNRKDVRRIKNLKNKYLGRKAVILCNGPSLRSVDFSILNDSGAIVIGLNKINLFDADVKPRLDFICATNTHVIEQNAEYYMQTDIPVFLEALKARHLGVSSDNIISCFPFNFISFSSNLEEGFYPGYTVTYMAMQICYHLGFDEVALVGCDHSFKEKGKANSETKTEGGDDSHFIKGYFSENQVWQLPDLPMSEISYSLAKINFENAGKKIYNATAGGKLELFDRISLEEYLKS